MVKVWGAGTFDEDGTLMRKMAIFPPTQRIESSHYLEKRRKTLGEG